MRDKTKPIVDFSNSHLSMVAKKFLSFLKNYYIDLLIFLTPFLMFYWMIPFVSQTTFATDNWLAARAQIEFMFAIKTGTFPVHTMSNIGDMPASLLIHMSQAFLPFPYIASIMPGYWHGKAYEWITFIQFLTLPIAHIALFAFLKRLNINNTISFILSTITTYNPACLFVLDLYGPWAAHLFLCATIGLYYLKTTKYKGPILITVASYWVINSMEGAYIYYGIICAVFFTGIIPFFVYIFSPTKRPARKTVTVFWLKTGLFLFLSLLLSSANLLFFYFDTVKQTGVASVTKDYLWAVDYSDTIVGVLSNFFSPLRSAFTGSFGSTSLLLPAAMIPMLLLLRVKIPGVIWIIWIFVLIAVLHMMGPHTPIHFLMWKYLPLANNIRIPGRICMLLPVMFMLLLAWLFNKAKDTTIKIPGARIENLSPAIILSLAGLILLMLLIFLLRDINILSPLTKNYLLLIPSWVEPFTIVAGVVTLILLALYGAAPIRNKQLVETILCVIVLIDLLVLLRYNLLSAALTQNDSILPTISQLYTQKRVTVNCGPNYFWLIGDPFSKKAVIEQRENYRLEPYLGKIYRKYHYVSSLAEAYKFLNHITDQDVAVIESNKPVSTKLKFATPDNDRYYNDSSSDSVDLIYSSYNKMIFRAFANKPSFFVFSYSYDENWRAWVDGEKAKIYPANGLSQAVFLGEGEHIIEFRYWSWPAFWGITISCITLSVIGIAIGIRRGDKKLVDCLVATIFLIVACTIFMVWYRSLYSGENLNTSYHWGSPLKERIYNLAYNKKTSMSSIASVDVELSTTKSCYKSCNGVDGGRFFPSCFLTANEAYPWWEVDLGKIEKIGSIALHTSFQGFEHDKKILFCHDSNALFFNGLPLIISVSKDHKEWKVAKLNTILKDQPQVIAPEHPIEARYVRITATGQCRLCFNEIEIYPP